MSSIKTCNNCINKYYDELTPVCVKAFKELDLVTGKAYYSSCRYARNSDHLCGKEAKFYEERLSIFSLIKKLFK